MRSDGLVGEVEKEETDGTEDELISLLIPVAREGTDDVVVEDVSNIVAGIAAVDMMMTIGTAEY